MSTPNKVVVVGGGPVGLVLTYQLASFKDADETPLYDVTVLEKEVEFTRKKIVLATAETLQAFPEDVVKNLLGEKKPGCYVFPPEEDQWARCYQEKLPLASIRVSLLEKALLEYVEKMSNVTVVRGFDHLRFRGQEVVVVSAKVDDKVHERTYPFDVLIGADGTNSAVRTDVLKTSYVPLLTYAEPLYGAVFNFDGEQLGLEKGIEEVDRERVKQQKQQNRYRFLRGQQPFYHIGFKIGVEEHRAIQRGYVLDETKEYLQNVCQLVLEGKKCDMDKMSEMNSFEIQPHRAVRFRGFSNGQPVFLVGDAAMSTHYFTGAGLNNGIETVMLLVAELEHRPDGYFLPVYYDDAMEQLVTQLQSNIQFVSEGGCYCDARERDLCTCLPDIPVEYQSVRTPMDDLALKIQQGTEWKALQPDVDRMSTKALWPRRYGYAPKLFSHAILSNNWVQAKALVNAGYPFWTQELERDLLETQKKNVTRDMWETLLNINQTNETDAKKLVERQERIELAKAHAPEKAQPPPQLVPFPPAPIKVLAEDALSLTPSPLPESIPPPPPLPGSIPPPPPLPGSSIPQPTKAVPQHLLEKVIANEELFQKLYELGKEEKEEAEAEEVMDPILKKYKNNLEVLENYLNLMNDMNKLTELKTYQEFEDLLERYAKEHPDAKGNPVIANLLLRANLKERNIKEPPRPKPKKVQLSPEEEEAKKQLEAKQQEEKKKSKELDEIKENAKRKMINVKKTWMDWALKNQMNFMQLRSGTKKWFGTSAPEFPEGSLRPNDLSDEAVEKFLKLNLKEREKMDIKTGKSHFTFKSAPLEVKKVCKEIEGLWEGLAEERQVLQSEMRRAQNLTSDEIRAIHILRPYVGSCEQKLTDIIPDEDLLTKRLGFVVPVER